jgi:hypothetical protein
VVDWTRLVVTLKVAVVEPVRTLTLEGAVATAVLLLNSSIGPVLGTAGPVSVIVPVQDWPPTTITGFNVKDLTV